MARKVTRAEYHKTRLKRSVDISQTSWTDRNKKTKTPGRLTGPKGKLYTGLVNLGPDKGIAVYKKGKRVHWRGKGLTSPKSSSGSAKTSTGGKSVKEVTKPPATVTTNRVDTSTIKGISAASGKSFKTSTPRTPGTSPRQVSSRYRGSGARGAQMIAPTPKNSLAAISRRTSGYFRGTAASPTVRNRPKGQTYRGALQAKRRTDTRNQNRNAAVIASLPLLAVGGVTGAAVGAVARTGTAAAAGARTGIASLGRVGVATKRTAAAKPVSTAKDVGGKTKGVSKVTGGPLKAGKPVAPTAKKPTAAQAAAAKRSAAAKKAAATRKANASKKTTATKSTTRRRRK